MITLDTKTKYPKNVYLMYLFSTLIVLFFVSIPLAGVFKNFIGAFIFLVFIIGIPKFIYDAVRIDNVSFIVSENSLEKNYGVLTKYSSAITFDQIQNIKSATSSFLDIFKLTRLNIWTASPAQISIVKGNSQNNPEVTLLLDSEDANWLKNYIINRSTQPVDVSIVNKPEELINKN